MASRRLIVCDGELPAAVDATGADVMQFGAFVAKVREPGWLAQALFSRPEAGLVVPYLPLRPRPFASAVLLRAISRGRCWVRDAQGAIEPIGLASILRLGGRLVADAIARGGVVRTARREVADLMAWTRSDRARPALEAGPPVVLKTDLWLASAAGGSVTHLAGVVNHLGEFFGTPFVFSTAPNPLITAPHRFELILPAPRFHDFRAVPSLAFSSQARRQVLETLAGTRPSFLYQRYGLDNYAGPWLARDLGVPLVVEYNGSEVWIGRHWGSGRAGDALSGDIEELALASANLVVVVSEPLRAELLERGVPASRILVNPNGVDPDAFRPDLDAAALRASLGLEGKRVIGFIGTFGAWHGTEVLVEAFARVLDARPDWRTTTRLLLIGDGVRRPATEALVDQRGLRDACVFTGLVPQSDGPRYLACCDVLAAPHVPNRDGSAFFGSPTKLFEYLAMGRPVVASRLGQMGEVIEHGKTGWLVAPGDAGALADGIATVAGDEALAASLGRAGREAVIERHSWRAHVQRIAAALREACA